MVRFKIPARPGPPDDRPSGRPLDEAVLREATSRTLEAAFRLVDWRLTLERGAVEMPARATPGHDLLVSLLRDKEVRPRARLPAARPAAARAGHRAHLSRAVQRGIPRSRPAAASCWSAARLARARGRAGVGQRRARPSAHRGGARRSTGRSRCWLRGAAGPPAGRAGRDAALPGCVPRGRAGAHPTSGRGWRRRRRRRPACSSHACWSGRCACWARRGSARRPMRPDARTIGHVQRCSSSRRAASPARCPPPTWR